jgi:hypothetical protein
MAISEAQLSTWSAIGSVTQSADTYAPIKRALENANAPYAKNYEVFLQGSYGNDTNIYSESDVDVVLRFRSPWYHDLSNLTVAESAAYDSSYPNGTESQSGLKAQVAAWLAQNFNGVVSGEKAIFVPGNGSRRDADVLVACELRRYYSFTNVQMQRFESGICFFLANGKRIENFPKQHMANCTTKHQETQKRFKPTVRIFKNLRRRMVADGSLAADTAPSYFIESALWNVPKGQFVAGHQDTFINCWKWLRQADATKLTTASGLHTLVLDGHPECWPKSNFETFLTAVAQTWDNWP